MNEALRVVKPTGKIVVLTPTGKKSLLSSIAEVKSFTHSENNWTFMVWKLLTSGGGRKWQQEKWLLQYSETQKLKYSTSITFNNNASIEEIRSSISN